MEEKPKILECFTSKTLRGIVNFVNNAGLTKDNLFYLDKEDKIYSLLYFE